jgi:hypothetical protein
MKAILLPLAGLSAAAMGAPIAGVEAVSVSASPGAAAFVLKSGALGIAKGGQVETVAAPTGSKVVFAASGSDGIAWVTRATEGDPHFKLFIRRGDAVSDAEIPSTLVFSRIAWVGKEVGLLGPRGGTIYSLDRKAFIDPVSALGANAGLTFVGSYIAPGENGAWAGIRPWRWTDAASGKVVQSRVVAFDAAGKERGSMLTFAPRYKSVGGKTDSEGRIESEAFVVAQSRLAVGAGDIGAFEDDGLAWAPFSRDDWQFLRQRVEGPAMAAGDKTILAAGLAWRIRGGALIAHHPESGVSFAYLPWNAKLGAPVDMASTGSTIWVVCQRGVLELDPAKTDGQGYGGFIRARVGQFGALATDRERALVGSAMTFLGVPYKWGGNDRRGLDCSGLVVQSYLMLGIKLPRTSTDLRVTGIGKVVTDELRVGDVLTLPGHAAIYIGNGQTIEARTSSQSVAKWDIWSRSDVVVRRFL